MDINFVKLHTCGLDYIVLDGIKSYLSDETDFAKLGERITNRRHGVGGCGFLVLRAGKREPVAARFFGAQGGESEPGPDALRCIGRYAYDSGLLSKNESKIETNTATLRLAMLDGQNIAVVLGPPFSPPDLEEIRETPHLSLDQVTSFDGKKYSFTPLVLGDAHAVLYSTDRPVSIPALAKQLGKHPVYAEPPSVNIVRVYSRDEIRIRTWQPSLRETLASGAGSGAAVVASVIHGFTDRDVLVHNRGGNLYVQWDEEANAVLVTGSVEYAFTGTFYWEPDEKALPS